jgi:hypothetical protein
MSMNRVSVTGAVAGADILAFVSRTNWTSTQHEANMSLEEIVDLLDRHGRRATYGAVAAVLGHSPRSLLRGRERGRQFSWIVNRETGMPTGYPEELIDPRLKESGPVIVTDRELRTWLENPA